MKMKTRGVILVILGIAGIIFTSTFDIILRKPKNMIGPKSMAGFIVCAFLIIQGLISLFKKPKA